VRPVVLTRRSQVVPLVVGVVLAAVLALPPSSRSTTTTAPAVAPALEQVAAFTPRTGATFNRPIGSRAEQDRVHALVNRTIDAVPRGGTIRIAVFSFSEKATADALLRAKARGVRVRIVFDDHTIYPQEARLRRALGHDADASSWVLYCSHACRGTGGDMHDKFFLFSRAGGAPNVTMVGSNNMTSYNSEQQWADVYTVANNERLYSTYVDLFSQLRTSRLSSTQRTAAYSEVGYGRWQAQFFPAPSVTPSSDPAMRTLSKIGCTAGAGTGVDGHTLVRLSQHAWFGDRGRYLARKVADLSRAGCLVRVIPGKSVGDGVLDTLRQAGVAIARVRHSSVHTHQKVLTVSGTFDGNPRAEVVFTGSHNYTDRALTCDDTVLRIAGAAAYDQYAANFRDIWHHG
jgi:phosphatidylserine/phosphatidylglycerophosphate/cardiolipin synthase-like enzyme